MLSSNKKDIVAIGRRLHQLRNMLRLQQQEFAVGLGVSLSHIGKLESGIGGVSDAVLFTAAEFCSVPFEWLRYGNGPEPSPTELQMSQARKWADKRQLPKKNRATIKNLAPLNLSQIEDIISLCHNRQLQNLARKMAETTDCSYHKALSGMIREKLRQATKTTPL